MDSSINTSSNNIEYDSLLDNIIINDISTESKTNCEQIFYSDI